MCCGSIRQSRLIVEECMKWAHQRIVFGKRLIDQPVIRAKSVFSRSSTTILSANQSTIGSPR